MRKNYPNLLNTIFIEALLFKTNLNKRFLFLSFLLLSLNCYGQQCNAEIPTPFVSTTFDNLSVSTNTTGVCIPIVGCGINNGNNLINASLTDFATASFGILSAGTNHSLRVTDGNDTFSAGTFAGFKISPSGGLLNLDLLGGITIRTYNNGVLRETFSGASLLSLGLLTSPSDYIIGFNTSATFDAIEIVLNGGVTLLNSTNIYHAVIREYCAGPILECNTLTKLSLPTYPVAISQANTGVSGVSVGSVADVENAISSNDSDYASINLTVGLIASGSIAIKDPITDHPAGTYAGFEIENTNLLSLAALGNVVVSTYLNGVFREQFSGTDLVANVSLLSSGGRFKIGFISTQDFDEVKLSVNQTAGVSLGTTRVYGAVFQKFCSGPTLPCNLQTALSTPTYPVYINNVNSGINGLVCALCTVTNQDNLIDSDLTNYASVNLSVAVGTTGSLSVKDQITNYPVGTFAGYTIENPAFLNVDALEAVMITTYLDGVQQEIKSGNGALVAIGTDLLVGTGKQTIGFVSTMPFDEVQITLQNLVAVNLGEVKVYNAVFQRLCDPVVACNENYVWSNPAFPVTINFDNTGINGLACVGCAVNNTGNLLTADETDFANITLIAGVVGSGSVAVKDHLYTYPQGTFAGYVIRDLGTLAQVNLLQSLEISTYNNGVFQEARSAGQLIDLSLLGIDILGSTPGVYNFGFKTNLPFDEIKLTLNSVASVINSINVYGAFVNTSESDGGSGSGLECNLSSISLTKDGIYVDANSDGIVNVGDRINYLFSITNTGAKTLTNVTLSDDTATLVGTPIASLSAGSTDTTSYTATYNITQADIDAGVVYNLATVIATTNIGTNITATSIDPSPCTTCPVNSTCPECTATPLSQDSKLALVKTALYNGDPTKALVGDTITYTFSVTNSGNVTVDNIVINDAKLGVSNLAVTPATLAPSQTAVVTLQYTITQADIDAGMVTNSAVAVGENPQGDSVQDTSGTATSNDL
ncbi:putative repeat protein (TIGR01451 family), partial [Flavobacterium glaciei]